MAIVPEFVPGQEVMFEGVRWRIFARYKGSKPGWTYELRAVHQEETSLAASHRTVYAADLLNGFRLVPTEGVSYAAS